MKDIIFQAVFEVVGKEIKKNRVAEKRERKLLENKKKRLQERLFSK